MVAGAADERTTLGLACVTALRPREQAERVCRPAGCAAAAADCSGLARWNDKISRASGNQSHDAQLAEAVRPLRALGCEIAIDDLGVGSSGLKSWSAIRRSS